MSWHAFVDESESDRLRDPDTYLLAAAVLGVEDLVATRSAVDGLLLRGQRKVHWHTESPRRRRTIITAIRAMPVRHLVVVRDGRSGESAERRRRKCLERLLVELDTMGVERVCLEAREAKQNSRDLDFVQAMRAARALSSRVRLHHEPGPAEPLLWLPDAVAGAVTAGRLGDPTYRQTLASVLHEIQLDP